MNILRAKLPKFDEATNTLCAIVLEAALRKVIRVHFRSRLLPDPPPPKPSESAPTPQESSTSTPRNHLSALFRFIHDKRVQRHKASIPPGRLVQKGSLLPQVNPPRLAAHLQLALNKPSPETSAQSLHVRQYSEGLRYRSMKRGLKLKQRLVDEKFNRDFYMRRVQAINKRPSVPHLSRKGSFEQPKVRLLSDYYHKLAFPVHSRSKSLLNLP